MRILFFFMALFMLNLTVKSQSNIDRIQTQISTCQDESTELWFKIGEERDNMEKALEELRQGYYCSKCKRPASVIERTGTSFEKHLGDVKGERVPATAEMLASARAKWEGKIENARNRHNQKEQQCTNLKDQLQRTIQAEEERKRREQKRQEQERERKEQEAERKREAELKKREAENKAKEKTSSSESSGGSSSSSSKPTKSWQQLEYERKQLIQQQIQRQRNAAYSSANYKHQQRMRELEDTDLGENYRAEAIKKSRKYDNYNRHTSDAVFDQYKEDTSDNLNDDYDSFDDAMLPQSTQNTDWMSAIEKGFQAGGNFLQEIKKETRNFLNEKIEPYQSFLNQDDQNTYEDLDIISDNVDLVLNERIYGGNKMIAGYAHRVTSAIVDIGNRNLEMVDRVFDLVEYEEDGAALIEKEIEDWKEDFGWSIAGTIPGVKTAKSWSDRITTSKIYHDVSNSKPVKFLKDFGYFIFTGEHLDD